MKTRLLILSLLTSSFAFADDVRQLSPTVVTATRVETNSFDLPVSIDVVEKKDLEGQLNMTLSESLIRIPGITAQNRTQMAQDPQISTRGFGARSTFGVRGIRVYVDNIPLSTPDGIATPGNIDLGALKSIEIMRGPFSSLYGSSSGGVIQMRTQDAPKNPEIGFNALFGSYNTDKESAYASGIAKDVEYYVNYSKFSSDGYRVHSETEKDQATVKLKTKINSTTSITMLFNWIDQFANDPGGLTVAETVLNPKQASSNNITQNSRVSRDNKQVGFNIEHLINDNNSINLMAYIGNRNNLQYLYSSVYKTIDVEDGLHTKPFGRASAIARDFRGADIHWTNQGFVFNKKYQFTVGTTYGYQNDHRTDDMANNGNLLSGNLAYQLRDEKNIANNFDQYFQGQLAVLDNLDLHGGIRRSEVHFKNDDAINGSVGTYGAYIDGGTYNTTSLNAKFADGSGKVAYSKTTPVFGVVWKINPQFNFYGNYGKGFETPTFIEMAYKDTAGLGPNLSLKPSTSDNYEIGTKFFIGNNFHANVALFKVNTTNEIITGESNSAYTTYTNAGKTERKGIEISAEAKLPKDFNLYGAYTYLDAEFDSTSGSILKGNKISGTYKEQLYAELSWKYPSLGFTSALETRLNSHVYANDVNTVAAAGYAIFNLRAGFQQKIQDWKISEFVRIENIGEKEYVGSVKNNDTSQPTSRYFEPGASRNYLLGVNASYQF